MEKVRLGDICDILNGYAFKSERYVDNGIRILRITNVQKGFIEDKSPVFYPLRTESDIKNYILYENDLLISLTGNVGRVANLTKEYLPAALNQRVACIRIKDNNKVYKKYVFHMLNSDLFENKCINSAQGVAQKNMSTEWLKNYQINLPDIEEQITISNILDKVQDILNIRKKQIENFNEIIKSRFVEMFGDPQTNSHKWLKAPMGDFMTTLTDFSANGSYEYLDSNVVMYDEPNFALMVRTTDLEKQDFENDVKYIDENAYNILGKSKIFGNEIIMNKIGSAGKVYLMPCLNRPVSLGRNAFMFRFNEHINVIFIYYLLTSEYGTKEIIQHVRGAVTKTITKDATRSVKIIIPPINLQNQFAIFIKQIDKLKFDLQRSLEKVKYLKSSLMNKYFK